MTERLRIVEGDITKLDVEAVVTAANESLAGGGGVDGAIHRAAGPELHAACQKIGGCPTGSAVATDGFLLRAIWCIHAVGPIWRGGTENEAALLAGAYRSSLQEARRLGARSIAFPAISCGIYGYPITEAARIAVSTVREDLSRHDAPEEVLLCCFEPETLGAYSEALADLSR